MKTYKVTITMLDKTEEELLNKYLDIDSVPKLIEYLLGNNVEVKPFTNTTIEDMFGFNLNKNK